MTTENSQPDRSPSPITPNLFLVVGMIFAAALFRLVPHPPNFTPIGAMALFGGAALANRGLAIMMPLLAMFLSDLYLGFDASRVWIYGTMILVTLVGVTLQYRRRNPVAVVFGAFGASVLFFIVTNFAVWASGMYGHTISGFFLCYTKAIPFFHYTFAGDLVFSTALFGGLAFLESRVPASSAASLES